MKEEGEKASVQSLVEEPREAGKPGAAPSLLPPQLP